MVAIVIVHHPTVSPGEFMSLIKGLLKTAVAAKLIQVAQRELSKPENQQKIKDGIRRVQQAAKTRR
jgi:hypothetical protein